MLTLLDRGNEPGNAEKRTLRVSFNLKQFIQFSAKLFQFFKT